MSALELTVVQCSRATQVPALALRGARMVPRHALDLQLVLEELGGPDVFPADEPARPILGDVGKMSSDSPATATGVEPHDEAESGNGADDPAAEDEDLRRAGRVQAEDVHDLVAGDPDAEVRADEVHGRLLR